MSSRVNDLHILPRVRDSWSYLYIEHGKIDQDGKAIAVHDANGKVPVPCSTLTTLMLGPGANITHAAIRTLAANGCLVIWSGEEGVRFYAEGSGETRSAHNLMRQAWLWGDPKRRLQVVLRMYQMRFSEPFAEALTLQQIRGMEGVRVREAYAHASRETSVEWHGRSYRRDDWKSAGPINRAISCANSCLYGICHAAIVSAGYSTALGFVHTGQVLSFVYDIADLYKAEISIPVAFAAVAEGSENLERRVRYQCRDVFHSQRLLQRMVPDIDKVLAIEDEPQAATPSDIDGEAAPPSGLWDPRLGEVDGGVNWGDEPEGTRDGRDHS